MFKKQLSILVLLLNLFSYALLGQNIAPVIEWQKCFGTSGNDWPTDLIATSDGGYIFTGQLYSTATDGDAAGLVSHF